MSTDLEADLRREFDAVGAPSGLTFSPESVLRKAKRTILRRRIIAGGSAAIAVVMAVTGASLLTRPDDKSMPLPATRTAISDVVGAQVSFDSGTFRVELNRDPSVESNVKYSVVTPDGQQHDVGGSSTGKPGQEPDVTWGLGIVDGHPVTIGLVPSTARDVRITFADGVAYGTRSAELEGTGFTMFAVNYPATARPTEVESIRWHGDTGIMDGIANGQRLTGQVLPINTTVSIEVTLQPGDGGRTRVFGRLLVQDETFPDNEGLVSPLYDLNAVTTDAAGAAVVTGRQPILRKALNVVLTNDGPPVAAGILPAGSSGIGVILTTGPAPSPIIVSKALPDGRVIFALKAGNSAQSDPMDSIKAVTWTNADGTPGRKDVTQ